MTVWNRVAAALGAVLCAFASACASHSEASPALDGSIAADAASDDSASDGDGGNQVGDAAPQADVQTPPGLIELALIDHKGWHNFAAELDPLKSHQPATIACDIAGWYIEREQLEISTADCNYALLEHPALLAVAAGSEVLLELWHFDLNAPEPAEAHVAVLFGDKLQWETFIAIPSPGNVQQISFRATRALAPGDAVRLHLHNHGQNSWLLRTLHVLVPAS